MKEVGNVITFKFDQSSPEWYKHDEMNRVFLTQQVDYIRIRFITRGYIYLNTIYERFGVQWNPESENHCWIKGRDNFVIIFEESETEGEFIVAIGTD
jgi:hypothetical protein